MKHLDEQQMNDLADGTIAANAYAAADEHVAACADCAAAVARIRELRAALGALPRDIAPPARTLDAVRTRTAEPADSTPVTAVAPPAHWTLRPRTLAAAAVLLVVLSSGTTALLLRAFRQDAPVAAAPAASRSQEPAGSTRLVAVHAMERTYQREIDDLQRALAAGGTDLAPETLHIIEQNLAIVDRALTEARQALALDPGNDELTEMLRSGYERKLDVLRSVASWTRARS
jgi:anti-sigma factor RsiW